MAIKRDRLDSAFSDLVRGRAGWRSEYSGEVGHLQCCHIYGRRKRSVRWHPLNAVCLTSGEHRMFTEHPILFANWCNAKFGAEHMFKLAHLAAETRKFTPREIEGLYQDYKRQLDVMISVRASMSADGHAGRIEFEWPDPIIEATPRKKAKKARAKKPSKPLTNPTFKRKINGSTVRRDAA